MKASQLKNEYEEEMSGETTARNYDKNLFEDKADGIMDQRSDQEKIR